MGHEEAEVKEEARSVAEGVERLERALSQWDGRAAAERANYRSMVMMAAHAESPDMARGAFGSIEDAMSGTDFGKLREAVTAALGYLTRVAEKSIEEATANPVIIANLIGIVPAAANSIIEMLLVLLESVELPPEILASALFNTVTALDAEKLGKVLSVMSEQVESLHAGNLILGGDGPRLRAVSTEFAKRVLDNLDIDAAAGALVALGEDVEALSGSLVELAARDPRAVRAIARASSSVAGSMTRAVSAALDEAAAWPDELLVELARIDREHSDAAEAGRAVDSLVTLALRYREANPDANREMLTDLLRAVNTERLELVLKGAAADLGQAALANPGVRIALEPEEVGRRISGMLADFNRAAERGRFAEYLSRMAGAIDPEELGAAVRNGTLGMADAVFSSAGLVRSILRTAAAGAWKLASGVFRLIFER